MPALSLVICLYKERDLLVRLIQNSHDCYDDLVVVHDGPDTTNVRAVVEAAGGRFFERQREFQQEPHWPFAWEQAKHDWILRLDADEFPSQELKAWLQAFRMQPEPDTAISGFTCFWPMWNGRRAVSKKWPGGRCFLFNKQSVRFFGMAEQVPVPDGRMVAVDLVLQHQPKRSSHSLGNVLLRRQAYRWRNVIAISLLGKPTDLRCWRWDSKQWLLAWEQIRQRPVRTACVRLVMGALRSWRDMWRLERRIYLIAGLNAPLYHALICLQFWRLRRQARRRTG